MENENDKLTEQEQNNQPASEKESIQDINWRQFRETRERERKEKEEAIREAKKKEEEARALKAAMDALIEKSKSPAHNEHDEEDLSESERIKRAVQEALIENERKLEEQRRIKEQQEFPERLLQAYSDFNNVCTAENLDYLEYHYPEIAVGFRHMPDSFEKWSSIYKSIKRFVANPDSRKDEQKAQKNMSKPQSMSAGGNTQSSDIAPVRLDEQRKQDNWRRMQAALRSVK